MLSQSACFVSLLLLASLSLGNAYHHGRNVHKVVKRLTTTCNANAEYRTEDGQCNNLQNTDWGSAGSKVERLTPNAYADGISTPRSTGVGGPLPSAREVSVKCHKPDSVRADVTLMVMQWGQFLDHDITLSLDASVPEGTDCCTSSNSECLPIPLVNDEYFTSRTCMSFTRSHREVDSSGVEEQTNVLTAFVDASNIYGSSAAETTALRGSNGKLLSTLITNQGNFLPPGSNDSCDANPGEYCFLSGDERVNEQPGLAAMHTIWMREHNRIAAELQSKTSWDNNKIFQETRKIVGAMMQVITYNEWLPIVLGPYYHTGYSLQDSVYQYQPTTKPAIFNSFSTAAFRFGHSLVPEDITVDSQVLQFKNLFFSPTTVLNSMDELVDTFTDERGMDVDRNFAHSVTRHLFEDGDGTGFDLVSLNIQRGRDHGLPSYLTYRRLCNPTLPEPTQLSQIFPNDPEAQSAYSHIEDVDLFTGGISEPPVPQGLLGPTFACILGLQFNMLKLGDRFFYLNKEGNQRFSDAQIDELNKVKLSKVICDNTEVDQLQENIFRPQNLLTNPVKNCGAIPRMSIVNWTGGTGRRRGDRNRDGGRGGRRRG